MSDVIKYFMLKLAQGYANPDGTGDFLLIMTVFVFFLLIMTPGIKKTVDKMKNKKRP